MQNMLESTPLCNLEASDAVVWSSAFTVLFTNMRYSKDISNHGTDSSHS